MFRRTFLPVGMSALALACGSSGGSGGGSGGGGGASGAGGGIQQPADRIDIVVDANRDGVAKADDPADQDHETDWDATYGASFIANLDDDDIDTIRDADDEIVNGDGDTWDLATFLVNSWPTAPAGATGVVRIDQDAAESIHIFKYVEGVGPTLVLGSTGACTSPNDCSYVLEHRLTEDETKAGVTFGIEARRFKGLPMASLPVPAGMTYDDYKNQWTGLVDLSYEVQAGDGSLLTTEENPQGVDHATMRVAPWLMLGSLGAHDTMYSSIASPPFVDGNELAAQAAGVTYVQLSTSINTPGGWPDIWTEDYFQTGWTEFPGENGVSHGMRVFNARPWGRPPFNNPTKDQVLEYLPIRWILGNPEKGRPPAILGPDRAGIEIYDPSHAGTGHTQDSHGNHDVLPPHDGYPVGRIIHGNKILPETATFYDAQGPQGPAIVLDTTWLSVEHVDEFFHYVPANTPRGWKLLYASPALMTSMLQDLQSSGQGASVIHQGKSSGYAKSVDEALADTNLMTWAQESDVKIQGHIDTVKTEVGLTDEEIIGIPTWFEDLGANSKVAWNPGMVNMRMLGDVADIAKPFGPAVSGNDKFEEYIMTELGSPKNQLGSDGQGLNVHFTDDWYYHVAEGEVHCGTNESAAGIPGIWWESGK